MIQRILALATLALILCVPAFAADAPPTFEIADVHPSPVRVHKEFRGGLTHGDRYFLRDATMIDLITSTYEVDPASIFGGPPWLAFDRFDILAKTPPGTKENSAREMVRALLAGRFKLLVQTGTRTLPAFVLSAGKAPKLKPSVDQTGSESCQFQQQAQPKDGAPAGPVMFITFACTNITMKDFAAFLQDVGSPYMNHPVVDETDLKGEFDLTLQWSYRIPPNQDGVSIFTAVDKQLGLKLESKPAPLPVVVVVSANETPTPNPPDLDKFLPPSPPAEFEVATIKLANPAEKNFNINVQGNNVDIRYGTLQTLILNAWNIGADRIQNKPAFLNTVHYDVAGKASLDNTPQIPGHVPDLDMDDVKEMLKSLIIDRFKMTSHMGTGAVDVYALVAAGPKMKKADPANHPSCQEGPGLDGKDPRIANPLLNRLVSCQNMTMAELTQQLRNLAGGYVPSPVIDETHLEGAYDFTISFSKKGDDTKTRPANPSGEASGSTPAGAATASDPDLSGMSLYDALQKQLGLKLEKRDKVPVPVLVIDHIEDHPTDN